MWLDANIFETGGDTKAGSEPSYQATGNSSNVAFEGLKKSYIATRAHEKYGTLREEIRLSNMWDEIRFGRAIARAWEDAYAPTAGAFSTVCMQNMWCLIQQSGRANAALPESPPNVKYTYVTSLRRIPSMFTGLDEVIRNDYGPEGTSQSPRCRVRQR